MDAPNPKEHQCTAHNRKGARCGKSAAPGTNVCRNHGAAAPQVIAKAKQRLLAALDPAAGELVRLSTKAEDEGTRVRAIREIMDRAGLPAESKVTGQLEGEAVFRIVLDSSEKKKEEKDGSA